MSEHQALRTYAQSLFVETGRKIRLSRKTLNLFLRSRSSWGDPKTALLSIPYLHS